TAFSEGPGQLHSRALLLRLAASCAYRASLANQQRRGCLGARSLTRCCASASSACGAAFLRVSGLLCRAVSRSPPGARGPLTYHIARVVVQHSKTGRT